MPIEKLNVLFKLKAVIVPPTFLALFLWAAIVSKGGGPLVTGKAELTSTYMNTAYSALTGLNIMLGLFSSLAVNMPGKFRFFLSLGLSSQVVLGQPMLLIHMADKTSQILGASRKTVWQATTNSSSYQSLARLGLSCRSSLPPLTLISGVNLNGICLPSLPNSILEPPSSSLVPA